MKQEIEGYSQFGFDEVRHTIRLFMSRRGVTAVQITQQMDRTQSYMSRRLAGKTEFTLKDIEQIAVILDVDPAELLFPGRVVKLDQPQPDRVLAVSA